MGGEDICYICDKEIKSDQKRFYCGFVGRYRHSPSCTNPEKVKG